MKNSIKKLFSLRRALISNELEDLSELLADPDVDITEYERSLIQSIYELRISSAERSNYAPKANINLATLVSNTTNSTSKKIRFSFGIKTNGKRPEKLLSTISCIYAQGLEKATYEVIIVGDGDFSKFGLFPDLRIINAVEDARNGNLGSMMNLICEHAKYEYIVLLDDDILLLDGWADRVLFNLKESQFSFDIYAFPVKNTDGSRFWDDCFFSENIGSLLIPNFGDYYPLESSSWKYVTGGVCLLQKRVWLNCKWNSNLRFYEGEDVDWSVRAQKQGNKIGLMKNAYVVHNDHRYFQDGLRVLKKGI